MSPQYRGCLGTASLRSADVVTQQGGAVAAAGSSMMSGLPDGVAVPGFAYAQALANFSSPEFFAKFTEKGGTSKEYMSLISSVVSLGHSSNRVYSSSISGSSQASSVRSVKTGSATGSASIGRGKPKWSILRGLGKGGLSGTQKWRNEISADEQAKIDVVKPYGAGFCYLHAVRSGREREVAIRLGPNPMLSSLFDLSFDELEPLEVLAKLPASIDGSQVHLGPEVKSVKTLADVVVSFEKAPQTAPLYTLARGHGARVLAGVLSAATRVGADAKPADILVSVADPTDPGIDVNFETRGDTDMLASADVSVTDWKLEDDFVFCTVRKQGYILRNHRICSVEEFKQGVRFEVVPVGSGYVINMHTVQGVSFVSFDEAVSAADESVKLKKDLVAFFFGSELARDV